MYSQGVTVVGVSLSDGRLIGLSEISSRSSLLGIKVDKI
jgi:hypothetical protein